MAGAAGIDPEPPAQHNGAINRRNSPGRLLWAHRPGFLGSGIGPVWMDVRLPGCYIPSDPAVRERPDQGRWHRKRDFPLYVLVLRAPWRCDIPEKRIDTFP